MDDLRVTRVPPGGVTAIGDGTRRSYQRPGERRSDSERKRPPDELAFLLRRSNVATSDLVNTRVELLHEGDDLVIRIVDAATGEVVGEMTGEQLARLAQEANITTGIIGEWRQ
jgi:hypothetical protein